MSRCRRHARQRKAARLRGVRLADRIMGSAPRAQAGDVTRTTWEVLRVQREACREGGVPVPFLARVETGTLVVRWPGSGPDSRKILLGNLRRISPAWIRESWDVRP